MKLTPTQQRLVDLMQRGYTLMWWGYNGPELEGFPHWPQVRTVRALIRDGVLRWGTPHNQTQCEAGIFPVVLTEEWKG
jgi:hypothetical protein